MGFDLMLIATTANGLAIPAGVKCCFCHFLLDDGVGLSGCSHNCCYKCMSKSASAESKCPIDGQPFDKRRYYHLSEDIEIWLSNIKLKCQWFDGQNCTATAIALRNAHRHRQVCPNNPTIKMSKEQKNLVKLVHNWMQNNQIMKSGQKGDKRSDSCNPLQQRVDENSINSSHRSNPKNHVRPKPRNGYGFRPNKRTIGHRFFTNDMSPEIDYNWRN